MKFEDYTWDKEFEIKGYFSELPGDFINNSLSGILHYSPSEIILELFGAFDDENEISFGFGKYLEKIYGFSNHLTVFIYWHCFLLTVFISGVTIPQFSENWNQESIYWNA